ncbi:hypothetical protein ACHAXA_002261 [Cyclostephanos tholiformis]|uniref:Uncharacterized protein n=1 Tax=Cyclostephanos tholiformis TaxID=382380 RepID=A0ABD3RSA3_9STRA
MRPPDGGDAAGGNAARSKCLPRRTAMLLFSGLINSDCNAYYVGPYTASRPMKRTCGMHLYDKIRPGSTGDYLNNLSTNINRRDESGARDNKSADAAIDARIEPSGEKMSAIENAQFTFNNVASSVTSAMGRRTSEITCGFASVAERGGSDIQSLAANAISNVEKVTKKGTRDVRRAVKKNTDGLVATGRGFSDMQFFEVISFAPKLEATEIVKWIDSQTRSGSDMIGSKARTLVLKFTGKREYRFGDVTKELIRRVVSQEVNMKEWILLLKILLTLGATIGPLAELLPFTLLLEALNLSLEQKVGGKILEVLSQTLDNRIVAALFTTDDKSLIGDVIKRSVLSGVLDFTGKSNYESGDIQRAVQRGQQRDCTDSMKLDLDIDSEFEEWDRLFVEKIETEDYIGTQAKVMDMKIALALEECEAISKKKYGEYC